MKILTKPSFDEEKIVWDKDIDYVIGIDEVGRGAFAGPIVAAGVVFSKEIDAGLLCDINDSKLVKPLARRKCAKTVEENALFYTVEQIGIAFINKHGIGKANSAVFRKVLTTLISKLPPGSEFFILIDGFHKKYLPGGINKQKGIVKGDQKSISIASASILAKVHRDEYMKNLHKTYPAYEFSKNKGYGTKKHQSALKEFGLSKIHRTSFNLAKFAAI